MNHDALDSFVVFAKHLNFTTAARELHLSQPAFHTKIRKLGEELGVTLYLKQGRNLVLTRDGEQVAVFGREMQRQTVDFTARLSGSAPAPITLAAGRGAYLYLLGDAIRRHLRRFQDLKILTMPGPETVQAVEAGIAQLGVVARAPEDREFRVDLIRQVGQKVVVQKSHRLASRKSITPVDLNGEALIVPPRQRPHRTQLETVLASAGVSWNVAVEAEGWDLMVHFVRMGIGAAVVNDFVPVPRTLRGIPVQGFPEIPYHVIRKPAHTSEPADFLATAIRKSAGV